MSNIGVIHEDCVGFGDGTGFEVLSETDQEKVEKYKEFQPLNEKKETEEK